MKKNEKNMKPIILCCGASGRAVVFGHVSKWPEKGEPVTLHNARMILYWSSACGGLFGLAANGPRENTRITPSIGKTTETVWQEVVEVSAAAAKALDEWPSC